jgi:hypothetical protein
MMMTREEAEREAVRRWGPGATAWYRRTVAGYLECVVDIGDAHRFAVGACLVCGQGWTFEAAFTDAESRGYA